jgi:hypothetical protein
MASPVKIRLKSGGREIEIEASRDDVDALLKEWWGHERQDDDGEDSVGGAAGTGEVKKVRKRRASGRSAPLKQDDQGDPTLDAHEIANAVRRHGKIAIFEKKILHVQGDAYHKVAFIAWLIGKPLTSGQIHRALNQLGVKIDLPRVSKVLKNNISKFITTGQRRPGGGAPSGYSLSGAAKAEFERWLVQTES